MTSGQSHTVHQALDGGWGWVIVFAGFLTFFMTTGTMMSMSVMYVAWLEEFHTGRGITSWIIAVAVAVMFGSGPIPAHFAIRFGYKAVMIIGGLMSFAGFVMSSFATSVPMLIFTMGIVAGLGCGFCFLPAIAMISLYFDRYRSVAMGIAQSGVGIGSLVGAQILHLLVETFGWRGAMLVAGGIQLNLVVLALLMRPLTPGPAVTEDFVVEVQEVESVGNGDCNEEEEEEHTTESLLGGDRTSRRSLAGWSERDDGGSVIGDSRTDITTGDSRKDITTGNFRRNTMGDSPRDVSRRVSVDKDHDALLLQTNGSVVGESPTQQQTLLSVPPSANPQIRRLLEMEGGAGRVRGGRSLQHLAVPMGKGPSRLFASAHELNPNATRKRHGGSPLVKDPSSTKHSGNLDIMLSGSMHSLYLIKNNILKYDASYSHHSLNQEVSSSSTKSDDDDVESQECQRRGGCSAHRSCLATLSSNLELLKDPTFLVFIISNILTNLTFFMPNLYMVDRALDEGLDKNAATILVSINGAGNVFGRFFFGYLADKNIMRRINWYIFVLTVSGLATCFSPLCGGSVVLHGIYAFTFGTFIGAYGTLAPVVTVDLVGVELVGQAYGLALFFMGVSGLFGSPLAGWIFDLTGNYTTSFVVHGVFLLVSAFVLIPVTIYMGRRQKKLDMDT